MSFEQERVAEYCTACGGIYPEDHADGAGLCPECGNLYAVGSYASCTNCPFSQGGVFSLALLGNASLLEFLTAQGINPVYPDSERFNEVVMD